MNYIIGIVLCLFSISPFVCELRPQILFSRCHIWGERCFSISPNLERVLADRIREVAILLKIFDSIMLARTLAPSRRDHPLPD